MEDIILLDTGILINFLADKEAAAEIMEEILTKGMGAVSARTLYHKMPLFTSKYSHFSRIPKLQLYTP